MKDTIIAGAKRTASKLSSQRKMAYYCSWVNPSDLYILFDIPSCWKFKLLLGNPIQACHFSSLLLIETGEHIKNFLLETRTQLINRFQTRFAIVVLVILACIAFFNNLGTFSLD